MKVDKPNILIILSDCTRPDKMSCYGYNRRTTPNVDKIAKEGTIFTNVISQGVWTLPTHSSLFTGLYPSEHGLLSATEKLDIQLDLKIKTLAEQLRELGYITAGISNNPWVGNLSDLNRGFDFFMESDGSIQDNLGLDVKIPFKISTINKIQSIAGGFTFKLLIPYLVKRPEFTNFSIDLAKKIVTYSEEKDKIFFIFMNLMDTHQPYYPPKTILKKISDNKYRFSSSYQNYKIRKFLGGQKIENGIRVLNDYYDASLRYQDQEIENMFNFLREKRVIDETLIFFTSDHGKNLGEHDFKDQIQYLKDNILRIPLVVRYPDLFPQNSEINENVQLIDINYTIRKILGIPSIHKNDCTLMDAINGQGREFSYFEAEVPYNILQKKVGETNERDEIKGVISGQNKLFESRNKGFIFSEFKGKLSDEKFIICEKPEEHLKLFNYLDKQKKMFTQNKKSKNEKQRISEIIRKKFGKNSG